MIIIYKKYYCDKCDKEFQHKEECLDHEEDCDGIPFLDIKWITIPLDEYDKLLVDSEILDRLSDDDYKDVMDMLNNWNEEEGE